MSFPYIYHWLPTADNLATISSARSYTVPLADPYIEMPINSSYTAQLNVPINAGGPFVFGETTGGVYEIKDFVRNLSLTWGAGAVPGGGGTVLAEGIGYENEFGNLQTQTGLKHITETINWPAAPGQTVFGEKLFKKITRLINSDSTGTGAGETISVGYGGMGATDYYFVDYNKPYLGLTVEGTPYDITDNTLSWGAWASCTVPEEIDSNQGIVVRRLFPYYIPPFQVVAPGTAGAQGFLPYPQAIVWATVDDQNAVNPALSENEFFLTIIQQGTRS